MFEVSTKDITLKFPPEVAEMQNDPDLNHLVPVGRDMMLKFRKHDIGKNGMILFFFINEYTYKNKKLCKLSNTHLSKATEIPRSEVIKAIKSLNKCGLIISVMPSHNSTQIHIITSFLGDGNLLLDNTNYIAKQINADSKELLVHINNSISLMSKDE